MNNNNNSLCRVEPLQELQPTMKQRTVPFPFNTLIYLKYSRAYFGWINYICCVCLLMRLHTGQYNTCLACWMDETGKAQRAMIHTHSVSAVRPSVIQKKRPICLWILSWNFIPHANCCSLIHNVASFDYSPANRLDTNRLAYKKKLLSQSTCHRDKLFEFCSQQMHKSRSIRAKHTHTSTPQDINAYQYTKY